MHCLRSSFGDVFLANDSGKQVSKYLRRMLIPRARKLVYPTQFGGGCNGGETAFAHLYSRCAFHSCRCLGLSAAILFLDAVTAFASMLRRTMFDLNSGDEAWIHKLSNSQDLNNF